MKKLLLIVFMMMILSGISYAEDDIFSEDNLFDEGDFFSDNIVSNDVEEELNKQGVGVSGELKTKTISTGYSYLNDWTELGNEDKQIILTTINGNLYFDIRLKNGTKSFINVAADSDLEGESNISLKEVFVDTNINNKVYFRAGKQVLKWGKCYLWNPTDLINVEKKDFMDLSKSREGVNGLKVHIPFGVEKNIYLFVDMNDIEELNESAIAGKYEFLVGNTELSLSAWSQKDYRPVYGLDVSGRIFDIDVNAEMGLFPGDNSYKLDYDTLQFVKGSKEYIPRISIGFTKFFDQGDINNRISLTSELYYNPDGYDKNIFTRIEAAGNPMLKNIYLMDYYQPNMNSKYYLALFSSVKKFINPDITLNLNAIGNLVDYSKTVTAGLNYNHPLNNWSVGLNLTGYYGDRFTEATLMGNKFSVGLSTSISF